MGWTGFVGSKARVRALVSVAAVLLALVGCAAEGSDGDSGAGGLGGAGGVGATGGVGGTTGGAGGVSGAAGAAGVVATGGTGGMMAGVGGMMGGVGGMTGGVGGMTGGAGGMTGGAGGTGGAIMRGDAPTEASATANGPYTVDSYTSGFRMPMDFKGGTIWYPTDADAPFGAVAICPGWTAPETAIIEWGEFLASHGIIVLTIETTTTGDQVADRIPAQMDALAVITEENTREGSPLKGKVDVNRLGLMGWSMGGGATWANLAMHPELKAGVSFAGHYATYDGGTGSFAANITVPVQMLAGQADLGFLGGAMSQPIYDMVPESTPKMIYEVATGDHNIANSPSGNGGAMGRYGLSWLKVFLEGDERYRALLKVEGPGASDFRSNL